MYHENLLHKIILIKINSANVADWTFVNCIAILSNYFGGEVKFVLVAKVNKSLTRIFSENISECFRINTNASKTWLKYRPFNRKRVVGRIRLGASYFTILREKHFCYRNGIETVFYAKNFEARITQCFAVLSVKHFFYRNSALG